MLLNISNIKAKNKDLDMLYSGGTTDIKFLIPPESKAVRGFDDFRKAEAFWMSPDLTPCTR